MSELLAFVVVALAVVESVAVAVGLGLVPERVPALELELAVLAEHVDAACCSGRQLRQPVAVPWHSAAEGVAAGSGLGRRSSVGQSCYC